MRMTQALLIVFEVSLMALSISLPSIRSLHKQLIHQFIGCGPFPATAMAAKNQLWGKTEVGVSSSVTGLHHFSVAHVMGAIIRALVNIYSNSNQITLRTTQRCATHRLYETLRLFLSRLRVVNEPMVTAGRVAPSVTAFWPIREVNLVLLTGNLFHPRWKYWAPFFYLCSRLSVTFYPEIIPNSYFHSSKSLQRSSI